MEANHATIHKIPAAPTTRNGSAPEATARVRALFHEKQQQIREQITQLQVIENDVNEALAYLDQTAAVDTLAAVARDEPAFRVNALAALSAMDDVMAYDALRSLLEEELKDLYDAEKQLTKALPKLAQ